MAQWVGALLVAHVLLTMIAQEALAALMAQSAGALLVAQWKQGVLGEHRALAFLQERSVESFSAEH